MLNLYYLNLNNISLSKEYTSLLPKYRRAKFERIVHRDSKLQSLGAGLLLRSFFGERVPLKNSCGKPYFKDGPFFNLTHSGKYVALAISDKSVGCDIERVREIEFLKAGRLVFCESEMKYLEASDDVAGAFFRLWTKKEAFTKCIGEGFNLPSKSVDLSGDKVQYKGDWYFFKEYMLEDYKIMICSTESSFPESPEEVVDFRADNQFCC